MSQQLKQTCFFHLSSFGKTQSQMQNACHPSVLFINPDVHNYFWRLLQWFALPSDTIFPMIAECGFPCLSLFPVNTPILGEEHNCGLQIIRPGDTSCSWVASCVNCPFRSVLGQRESVRSHFRSSCPPHWAILQKANILRRREGKVPKVMYAKVMRSTGHYLW